MARHWKRARVGDKETDEHENDDASDKCSRDHADDDRDGVVWVHDSEGDDALTDEAPGDDRNCAPDDAASLREEDPEGEGEEDSADDAIDEVEL